jgi:hypothetical protein
MTRNLVDQLNHEWAALVLEDATSLPQWAQACRPLASCHSLEQVLQAVRSAPDEVLAFLIHRCQLGDKTAGRTVLQSMLGKLVKMSYTGVAAQETNALDDLVTHMWCQIALYPLSARPIHVAANLALDTLKAAHRDWHTRTEVPVPTTAVISALDAGQLRVHSPGTPSAESLIDAAHRLGLVTDTTRDILLAVYGPEELSGELAAQRWSCSPTAIRTRCKEAVRGRMAPHAGQLLAA